jgi:uncharacterized protein (DUF2336 family)
MTSMLTQDDVRNLLEEKSADNRAATAGKIAAAFAGQTLSDDERRLAEEIFRIMVRDAEVRVREALSENLSETDALPHDVARTLADDVASVALPMLESSGVLTDEDLLEIVRSSDATRQTAIAGRKQVSETLSDALIDEGDEGVVARLVGNENAAISEAGLDRVIDRFGESPAVQAPLVDRSALPVRIAERLVSVVSDELQARLISRQGDRADLAANLILKARERATVGLSMASSEEQVAELIGSLQSSGRLTPSLVIRAVCMGDAIFFEHALAALSGVPVENARLLIHDRGGRGLKALYEKSGMPGAQFIAVRAAIDVMAETEYDGRDQDRERFTRRLIERILTQYDDLGVDLQSEDLDYLLGKMAELPTDHLEEA